MIAADIYSVEPRRGQGGWTWYTGSAGWFYRVATEGILGVTKRGDRLHLDPALPPEWDGYEAELASAKRSIASRSLPVPKTGR